MVGFAVTALGLALSGVGGCSSSQPKDGAAACGAGDTRTCVGPGACKGGQQCSQDGSWGDCLCENGNGTAGGTTGGNGAGGSGTSGSDTGGSAISSAGSAGCHVNPVVIVSSVHSNFEGAEPLKVLGLGVANGGNLSGSWMADSDGTGTISMTVEPDPDEPAKRDLHFVGSSHTKWGGDVAVSFIDAITPINVDLTGLRLQLNLKGSVSGGSVQAKFQNYDSFVPGCGCDSSPTATPDTGCYGGFIAPLQAGTPPISYSNVIDSPTFMPTPFGYHKSQRLDSTQIINFAIVVQNTGASVSWDLWISDIVIS